MAEIMSEGATTSRHEPFGSTSSRNSEAFYQTTSWMRKKGRNLCSKSFAQRKLPILKWLPLYNLSYLMHDIIAGITVGFTAIPQGIANAVIAGLDPQYGLYSGFMGSFTYIIFGSCKDITIGPTAILALMSQKYVQDHGPDFAVLLCFLSGCVILLLGLLNLGFLVDFISIPVTAGFTSAAAVTIASAQMTGLLGIKGRTDDFLQIWESVGENIHLTRLWDVTLGVGTIALLLILKKLNDFQMKGKKLTTRQMILNKTIWLASLSRNAVVAIIGTAMAYGFHANGQTPFKLTGEIEQGFPPMGSPPFSTTYHNQTYNFIDMCSEFGSSLVTLPLIAVLESIAIAKAFSKGKTLDATQEMIALGLCNITGSFVRSMPITGSFTRTSVNNASGVKTQMGGLFTGLLIILALVLLTTTFAYIPKASLAGIIITAMFFMVEYELVPLLWRTRKLDLLLLVITFFCCLFISLEYGIIIGVCTNVIYLLYNAARPEVDIQNIQVYTHELLIVTPDQSLMFPAAEYIRKQIIKVCVGLDSAAAVVVDGTHIKTIDVTMAEAMHNLSQDLKTRGQPVVFWNWSRSGRETCINANPNMKELFREGSTLEQLIVDLKLGSVSSEDGLSAIIVP